MSTDQHQPTAWVFTGGGSLGAIQVGMLKALAQFGLVPDMLIGASVGAINATYFACDPSYEGACRLETLWRGLKREEVFRFSFTGALLSLLGRRSYLFDTSVFQKFLLRNLPAANLEDTAVPCHIVASDMVSGEEVLISKGPAVPALLASAAIPGVFPPRAVGNRDLLDGGVANHSPISTAVKLGAIQIVVLPTGFTCAPESHPRGALNMALHALNLIIARQLMQDLDRFSKLASLHVIPSLCPQKTHPLDFHHTGELINQGYEVTTNWLNSGGLEQPLEFRFLKPHSH